MREAEPTLCSDGEDEGTGLLMSKAVSKVVFFSTACAWQVERQLENERAESKRKVEQVKRSMEDETADTKRKAKEVRRYASGLLLFYGCRLVLHPNR